MNLTYFLTLFAASAFFTGCTNLPASQPATQPIDTAAVVETEQVDTTAADFAYTPEPDSVSLPAPANSQQPTANSNFTLDYLMGKFDPAKHPDFVLIDSQYADEPGRYLRKDVLEIFKKMWEAAKADGVTLTIISATRNFYKQKEIWEKKWTGKTLIENGTNAAKKYPAPKARALKILEYSSMPGSSRHHWGTDVDLNDLDNFTFEKGQGKKVYQWLKKHASEYGFCQPYTKKGEARPNGYNEEKWHWSYIPVARKLTELAKSNLRNDLIGGFLGSEAAKEINIVEHYVLGINEECL